MLEAHPELAERLQRELEVDDQQDGPEIDLKLDPDDEDSAGLTISIDDEEDGGGVCETGDMEDADIPDWLAKRLTPERVQAICDKIIADKGKSLFAKLAENVASGLIFLLPLMALVLKMLYPLSKRYYVEHLLFFVHFHAFFFLLLILQISFARFAVAVSLIEAITTFILLASTFYIPVYLYKAMRRVYAQGHAVTIPKSIIMGIL